jgi:putative Mg2+ transporter-C (MgtC) family protein
MSDALSLPLQDVIFRLGAAAILGSIVGLERERLERAAGLRTHAIVAVASALIMIVSSYGFPILVVDGHQVIVLDPSRVAAQVVSGIGFLGAGVIFFRKNAVRGLTTAASIWAVAGIGLASGGGLYEAAALGTGFILLIQAGLRPIEHRFFIHHQDHRIELRATRNVESLATIEQAVDAANVEIRRLSLRPVREGTETRIDLVLGGIARPGSITRLLEQLNAIDGVNLVSYSGGTARLARAGGWEEVDEDEGFDNGDDNQP